MANLGYFIMLVIGILAGVGGTYFWQKKVRAALMEEVQHLRDKIKENM